MNISSLSKKQRVLFNEFWNANKKIFKGLKKKDFVPVWIDGYVCGKHSHDWKRKS